MAQGGNTGGAISWNKLFAFASVFGIPSVSLLVWIAVYGTKLVDKVETIQATQKEQGDDIRTIINNVAALNRRVDTIAQVQRDDKRDIDHQLELQALKDHGVGRRSGLFIERYVNGKLTFIPIR